MSASRVLARLAAPGAVLARVSGDVYGVFLKGDRRRRPVARTNSECVRELEASGAVCAVDEGAFVLSAAGGARARREEIETDDAFLAQHAPIVTRHVMGADGQTREVRGLDADVVIKRLAAMRDVGGGAWLSNAEIEAAARLRSDWAAGQRGLLRGSDWSAPPKSGGARGPGNAVEDAMMRHADARQRVAAALNGLAPPLRRAVERVCLHEDGLEALERAEGWPARSGKVALKLGLAQLAAR